MGAQLNRWARRKTVWVPITLALLAVVVWRSKPWEAPERIRSIEPVPLAAAVALDLAIVLLWGLRSWLLFQAASRPVPLRGLLPLAALAFTVNALSPGSTGEVLRAYLLRSRYGVSYATGGAVILVERFVALFYLAASAAAAWAISRSGATPSTLAAAASLLAASVILPVLAVRLLGRLPELPGRRLLGAPRSLKFGRGISRLEESLRPLVLRPKPMAGFFAVTAGIFAVFAAQLILVSASLGLALGPLEAWGALGLAMVAGVLSLLPFGLGATDVVLVTLLGITGVPVVEAGVVAISFRLTSTLPLGIAGGLAYAVIASGAESSRSLAGDDQA